MAAAPEATIVCACGGREFYATPDGFNSYVIECVKCGRTSEIAGNSSVTLTLRELPEKDEKARP